MTVVRVTLSSMSAQERAEYAHAIAVVAEAEQAAREARANERRA